MKPGHLTESKDGLFIMFAAIRSNDLPVIVVAILLMFATRSSLAFGLPLRAEITEFGVYEALGEEVQLPAPRTALGVMSVHDGFKLLFSETTLEAAKGATFGFRYTIYGAPDGFIEGLESRAIHPPILGGTGPSTTQSIVETYVFSEFGEAKGIVIYSLDLPSEIRPGEWTLELLRDGQVLVSQRFLLQ